MRSSSLVASLLLLHLLFCIAQGVRLGQGFLSVQHDQNIHVKEGVLTSKSAYKGVSAENNGIEENVKSRRSLAGERVPYVCRCDRLRCCTCITSNPPLIDS
ncbi:hypothetical protein RHMOL_Rhmol01G0043700 [Rhododendron molle]|uniref:Uncharacterized protein n=1 Tax=Rhododendron molle TaxID=49168 RepID=A0ACC0PYI7_RHOML|nr:hypothetical protein RHMOL_Rhmol01G0043700 [Rhododendron molle]